MNPPTTTKDANVNVKIQWSAADPNSHSLTGYKVFIQDNSRNNQAACTSVNTNPSATSCTVSFAVLRAAPYNLVQGGYVIARVQA
jgi:hypothetical protein